MKIKHITDEGNELRELINIGSGINYTNFYLIDRIRLHLLTLDSLVEEGLVKKISEDKKLQVFKLTNKGKKIYDKLYEEFIKYQK